MANYLIIHDGKLYINMERSTLNRWPSVTHRSIEAFRCNSGYFFPMHLAGPDAIDVIEGIPMETAGPADSFLGLLVCRDGLVYTYARVGSNVGRSRMQWRDSTMVRCFQTDYRPMIEFAMHMTDNDVPKALGVIEKICPINASSMLIVDIQELSDKITAEDLPLPEVLSPPKLRK